MDEIAELRLYFTIYMCYFYVLNIMIATCAKMESNIRGRMIQGEIESSSSRRRKQYDYLNRVVYESDIKCIDKLRMDRQCFHKLCRLLTTNGGLRGTKNVLVEEMVAMFLNIIAHHVKNRIIKFDFFRSAETVSRHFHAVLKSILLCHGVLLKKPEPLNENSNDHRWKWFKNCLGALDGTHIRVNVPRVDRPRYRTRKSEITTNVLGVCSHDMQFIYVLSGWEGSAHDGRVLRDAITKPNGLKVPNGFYYLVDSGYANCPGFLAPFRGQRYHLSSWSDGHQPVTPEEFFNMKHASARNVIERTFGLLKIRWKILASPSFYSISTQRRIINACCLIHNFIRKEMIEDPAEDEVTTLPLEENIENEIDNMEQISVNFRSFVDMVGPEFKTLADAAKQNAESAARHADSAVRNTEIASTREQARLEIEGKKKLLSQVLFNIEGLNDDEALIMLQALAKDEDQLKVFWDLPNDKKLRFCRIFLAKMSYIPHVA